MCVREFWCCGSTKDEEFGHKDYYTSKTNGEVKAPNNGTPAASKTNGEVKASNNGTPAANGEVKALNNGTSAATANDQLEVTGKEVVKPHPLPYDTSAHTNGDHDKKADAYVDMPVKKINPTAEAGFNTEDNKAIYGTATDKATTVMGYPTPGEYSSSNWNEPLYKDGYDSLDDDLKQFPAKRPQPPPKQIAMRKD